MKSGKETKNNIVLISRGDAQKYNIFPSNKFFTY